MYLVRGSTLWEQAVHHVYLVSRQYTRSVHRQQECQKTRLGYTMTNPHISTIKSTWAYLDSSLSRPKKTALTPLWCPLSVASICPLPTSHTTTVRSLDAEARRSPCELKAEWFTTSVWPLRE